MTYVALLRGINVGGKNITKMAALKACLENAGFDRVETFIQSGNVVFESGQRSAAKLTSQIDAAVESALGIRPRTDHVEEYGLASVRGGLDTQRHVFQGRMWTCPRCRRTRSMCRCFCATGPTRGRY